MLRKLRITLAVASILAVTWLFVDVTGLAARWLGFMARIQLLPALMAVNVGVIAGVLLLTLIFGRLYCSVICPLGIMQDGIARIGKKVRRNRYGYSPAWSLTRALTALVALTAAGAGFMWMLALVAPYSAYGRIARSFIQPLWLWVTGVPERYAGVGADVWLKGALTIGVAAATLAVIGVLAWRNGRTWCNTVCPVGTLLGVVSRWSLLRPVIDTDKCVNCGLCARNCKSACINPEEHTVDMSRCVVCMDCIDKCHSGAIKYTWKRPARKSAEAEEVADPERRRFMVMGAALAGAVALRAERRAPGGVSTNPERHTRIVPPGATSISRMESRCTACQLCIAECPNGVLRPSTDLAHLLQPECGYERGFCHPACTRCARVCPTGAIRPVTREEKARISIGHAVWLEENCLTPQGKYCGNCARHCPAGAIEMVSSNPADPAAYRIPRVDADKCTGCGACENCCPAQPQAAIYVEGYARHRILNK